MDGWTQERIDRWKGTRMGIYPEKEVSLVQYLSSKHTNAKKNFLVPCLNILSRSSEGGVRRGAARGWKGVQCFAHLGHTEPREIMMIALKSRVAYLSGKVPVLLASLPPSLPLAA